MGDVVPVDVVSDVACPWCYLGKRRLEAAIAVTPELQITVRWRPYRLDPSIPPAGMDRQDYVVRKFGSAGALDVAHQRLEAYGQAEGIDYRFDLIKRNPDTTDAHRLIRWADDEGKESLVVEALFSAYFTQGKDIGETEILAGIATAAGMDGEKVAARLASKEDRDLVVGQMNEAYRQGVTGVPTLIIDGRYGVVGAQPAATIAGALRKAAADRPATPS
jgi:predicted DsbA family dithiol-disulfide isomerase